MRETGTRNHLHESDPGFFHTLEGAIPVGASVCKFLLDREDANMSFCTAVLILLSLFCESR